MSSGLITDPELQSRLRPLISGLLARGASSTASVAVLALHDWWSSSDWAFDPVDLTPPNRVILCVDALRSIAHPSATLAQSADGRFLFVEATEVPGGQPFDVSGFLWKCGLSVIDVDRPRIDGAGGTWEFAIGIARWTPTRVEASELA